jgi:hypothetical protein
LFHNWSETHLLSWIQRILVLTLCPVSYNDAVGHSKRALFPPSFSSREVTNVRDILPLCICYNRKPAFQISKLLLQLRSLCAVLCQFCLFPCLATSAPARVHCSVNLLVNLVGFLVISFVRSACKEAVLIIGVLKLFRIDVWFFTTSGLSLAASIELVFKLEKYETTHTQRPLRMGLLVRGRYPTEW